MNVFKYFDTDVCIQMTTGTHIDTCTSPGMLRAGRPLIWKRIGTAALWILLVRVCWWSLWVCVCVWWLWWVFVHVWWSLMWKRIGKADHWILLVHVCWWSLSVCACVWWSFSVWVHVWWSLSLCVSAWSTSSVYVWLKNSISICTTGMYNIHCFRTCVSIESSQLFVHSPPTQATQTQSLKYKHTMVPNDVDPYTDYLRLVPGAQARQYSTMISGLWTSSRLLWRQLSALSEKPSTGVWCT